MITLNFRYKSIRQITGIQDLYRGIYRPDIFVLNSFYSSDHKRSAAYILLVIMVLIKSSQVTPYTFCGLHCLQNHFGSNFSFTSILLCQKIKTVKVVTNPKVYSTQQSVIINPIHSQTITECLSWVQALITRRQTWLCPQAAYSSRESVLAACVLVALFLLVIELQFQENQVFDSDIF